MVIDGFAELSKEVSLIFFVVLACHLLVLDGSMNVFKLFHTLKINLSNMKNSKKFLVTPRIKPGAAG